MPASFATQPVSVRVYPERVVVAAEGQIVCEHARVFARSHERQSTTTVFDWQKSADDTGTRLFARATPVFAPEQAEGYAAPALPEPPTNPLEPIEGAKAFIAANVAHGGCPACYVLRTYNMHLPCIDLFRDAEGYTSTKLHELIQWTGIKGRCSRPFGKRFGDDA